MADPRFFQRRGPFSLQELASTVGGTLDAGHSLQIHDVAPLELARADEISFLDGKRLADKLPETCAGACLVAPDAAAEAPSSARLIRVERPYLAYIELANLFHPEPALEPGVDTHAVVNASAQIGAGSRIDAGAVIGARVELGARCHVAAQAVIGPGCVLGPDCRVGAGVAISHALIGARVRIWPGARIGQPGFGFVPGSSGLERVPQLGRVVIHDDVDIGANATIDRGTAGDTVIGAGSIIDNLVQIAHNVTLGRGCIIVAQAGVSGSTTLDDHVVLGGRRA